MGKHDKQPAQRNRHWKWLAKINNKTSSRNNMILPLRWAMRLTCDNDVPYKVVPQENQVWSCNWLHTHTSRSHTPSPSPKVITNLSPPLSPHNPLELTYYDSHHWAHAPVSVDVSWRRLPRHNDVLQALGPWLNTITNPPRLGGSGMGSGDWNFNNPCSST